MKSNRLFTLILIILMMSLMFSVVSAQVKNPDTIIFATPGGPESLNPHWAYDTASGEIIYQTYDNLINYDGESTNKFVPMLSTEVPSVENGLVKDDGLTYIFPIRENVKFHNGAILTPEDVSIYNLPASTALHASPKGFTLG